MGAIKRGILLVTAQKGRQSGTNTYNNVVKQVGSAFKVDVEVEGVKI